MTTKKNDFVVQVVATCNFYYQEFCFIWLNFLIFLSAGHCHYNRVIFISHFSQIEATSDTSDTSDDTIKSLTHGYELSMCLKEENL